VTPDELRNVLERQAQQANAETDSAIRAVVLDAKSGYTPKSAYRAIIREIALRKGLPKKSGEKQITQFFA
jgi:hypothetical protein